MNYCPNPECPHKKQIGRPAEFNDDVYTCPDCGAPLTDTEPRDADDLHQEPNLVLLEQFAEPHGAHLARAKLASEGIAAFIGDEHTITMQWLWSNAIGGVKLYVAEPYAENARSILQQDCSHDLDDIVTESRQDAVCTCCPSCGSESVTMIKPFRKLGALSFLLPVLIILLPFISWKNRFECRNCGYVWRV